MPQKVKHKILVITKRNNPLLIQLPTNLKQSGENQKESDLDAIFKRGDLGMTDLPKTEQELNDLIAAKVQEKTDELTAQHNGQMATLRKKYDEDRRRNCC